MKLEQTMRLQPLPRNQWTSEKVQIAITKRKRPSTSAVTVTMNGMRATAITAATLVTARHWVLPRLLIKLLTRVGYVVRSDLYGSGNWVPQAAGLQTLTAQLLGWLHGLQLLRKRVATA